jgi:hypothetical protein
MKRRGFLNLFCASTGSCLIPAGIARMIREVGNGSSQLAILAPSTPAFDLYAQDQFGSYILHLGDPDAEPEYPTLRDFIWDRGYNPTESKGLRDYLLEWRSHDEESEGPLREAVRDLREQLDQPISDGEMSHWLDWDFEMRDSPMARAYRYLDDLPLADDREKSGFDFGSLSFIEGDRPGSNLTYVEIDSLSAIASLQHRLNELQTGARIVMA